MGLLTFVWVAVAIAPARRAAALPSTPIALRYSPFGAALLRLFIATLLVEMPFLFLNGVIRSQSLFLSARLRSAANVPLR